jgi:hypothetical protein
LKQLKFESVAEKAACPILTTFAIKKKLEIEYQRKFYETNPETDERFELYRPDFILHGGDFFLIVEIDGEKFHTNKFHETARDLYFENQGYTMLHVPAKIPLFHPNDFGNILNEAWIDYTPQEFPAHLYRMPVKLCKWCAHIRNSDQNSPHVRCKGNNCDCPCWRNIIV